LIEILQSNKIMAFGGDYIFIEGTYGHSVMARNIITELLTENVKSDYFTLEEAIEFIHKIFNRNVCRLFDLN